MRIEIFTPDLSNRHELTNATSMQFSDVYNGVGKFTVVLPMDDYNIGISELGAIVYLVDRKLAYTVEEVTNDCDENTITLNGYSLNNILDRRVISAEAKVVNVESDVYSIIKTNLRGLPVLLADEKGLTETVEETSLYGDGLLSAVSTVLSDADLGQRAVFDYKAKTITWEIYKGADRTVGLKRVAFEQERGTAPGLTIDQDMSEYKNVCYCEAQYKGGDKFVVSAGTVEGAERREMWATFRGDAQQDGESNTAFQSRVKQYAALQLGSHRNRLGFDMDADGSELGTAYNVGDLVWCVSLRHKLKFKTRITEAQFSQDEKSKSVKIIVGDPILTLKM